MVSDLVAQRYRITKKAGEGAVSIVYRAHDTVLDRDVALKVLKSGPGIDANAAERFDIEARAAAKIHNPHVAAIYDVIDSKRGRTIVMEYVDGPSLSDLLKGGRKVPEATAIDYAMQIAQALAAAHAQGILHRDIKPGNILLTQTDQVKVVDFGLVKAFDGSGQTFTQAGMFVGSVHYVSPEQAQGNPLTPGSDLYSLGVVMYQMLTGTLLFSGQSPVAIALAHVTSDSPTRRDLQAAMSPAVAAIVARLLQKDPAQRYGSAEEVVRALESAQESESPTTLTPVVAPPVRLKSPRREIAPQTAAIVVGAFCLLVFLIIALLSHPAAAIVPNVRGKSVQQARTILSRAGLTTAIRARSSLDAAPGTIVAQTPAAGTHLKKGATVKLFESTGAAFVTVPNIHGMTLGQVRDTLHRLNLQARTGVMMTAGVPPLSVVEQAPSAGTRVRQGTAMMVVIAVQPAPASVPAYAPPPPRGHRRHHGPGD